LSDNGGFQLYNPAGMGPCAAGLMIETFIAKEAKKGKFCRGKLLGCPGCRGRLGIAVWTKW